MKEIIFLIFTLLSLISYVFAGFLFGFHFSDKSAGMIMIFLIPLLISGLVTGIIAIYIKKTKNLKLNQFLIWLHYLNLILVFLGILALIYAFLE